MSDLIVVTFDNVEDAAKLRADLRKLEHDGRLSLNDAAVIEKDAAGKVHIQDEIDTGIKMGALTGGLLGMLLSFMFPIVGLVIGVGGGAMVGKLMDMGVDKNFIKDVTEALKPGASAIFVIIGKGDPTAALATIRPYEGTLYQTTLPSELESELRAALQ
jgi:uncharacterized membrane protein